MNLEGLTERKNRLGLIYYEDSTGLVTAKACKDCNKVKSLNQFSSDKKCFGRVKPQCKECKSRKYLNNREHHLERNKEWYQNNKEKHLQKCREYREQNAEKFKEWKKHWRAANAERVKIQNRNWYLQNKEIKLAKNKKWVENNRDKVRRSWRKYYCSNKDKILNRKKEYRESRKDWYAKYHRQYRIDNRDFVNRLMREWRKNNLDKVSLITQKRLARKSFLPDTLTDEQYNETLTYFGNTCALTGKKLNLEKEHAIPLSIGHGGTTFENCYPLVNGLNQSKGNKNIFEWFEANRQRFNLEQSRFDRLIEWLGKANGMTVEEYRDYVYWCHANPRDITQEDEVVAT